MAPGEGPLTSRNRVHRFPTHAAIPSVGRPREHASQARVRGSRDLDGLLARRIAGLLAAVLPAHEGRRLDRALAADVPARLAHAPSRAARAPGAAHDLARVLLHGPVRGRRCAVLRLVVPRQWRRLRDAVLVPQHPLCDPVARLLHDRPHRDIAVRVWCDGAVTEHLT